MTDETTPTAGVTAGEMAALLAEDREIRRLEARANQAQAALDAERLLTAQAREADDARVDAEIAEEQAEIERRVVEEPPGSMMHAFRESHARGLDVVPADLFDGLTADALRELEAKHRDIYDASLAAFGDAAIKGRI